MNSESTDLSSFLKILIRRCGDYWWKCFEHSAVEFKMSHLITFVAFIRVLQYTLDCISEVFLLLEFLNLKALDRLSAKFLPSTTGWISMKLLMTFIVTRGWTLLTLVIAN